MKRIRIDESSLMRNVPPPSPTFSANTMAKLYAKAVEEEKIVKRKIPMAMIIAAILVVALAATALAIGLRRSAEADAIVNARKALMDDYGLTSETIGCFNYQVSQDGDTWEITFTGAAWELSRLGSYTVILAPGEIPQTKWSHDDVDPTLWQEGNLDAPVWGQKQILKRLQMPQKEWEEYLRTTTLPPTIENEVDDRSLLIGTEEIYLMFLTVTPDENDIGEEEALVLAKQAAKERYAIEDDTFDNSINTVTLAVPAELGFKVNMIEGGVRQYIVVSRLPKPEEGRICTLVSSLDGKILECFWDVSIAKRTLPKGNLVDYRDAVTEFLGLGAFAVQPAEEKIRIVERMESEGHEDLIMHCVSDDLLVNQQSDESRLIDAADDAMFLAYGLNDEALAFFDVHVSSAQVNGESYFIIEYCPSMVDAEWGWNWDMFVSKKIGTYTVLLKSNVNDARIVWSKAGIWEDGEYSESTWGTAPAYHSKLLPMAHALRSSIERLVSKYPEDTTIYDYSFEDRAAFDTLFREAGIDANQFSSALPADGDLSYEEALALAKEAVLAEMPTALTPLDNADVTAMFDVSNPYETIWRFSFFFIHDGIEVDIGVAMDSKSGEIILTNVVTGGNG